MENIALTRQIWDTWLNVEYLDNAAHVVSAIHFSHTRNTVCELGSTQRSGCNKFDVSSLAASHYIARI